MNIVLPLFIIAFLPKKWKEKQIKLIWSKKSDDEIKLAYNDANDWINLLKGMLYNESIVTDCRDRLDNYILPEMKRRGMNDEQK